MRWGALVGVVALGPALRAQARPAPTGAGPPRVAPGAMVRPKGPPLARGGLRSDVVGCFALTSAPGPGSRGLAAYLYASPRVRLTAQAVRDVPLDAPRGGERRLERLDAAGRLLPPVPEEGVFARPRWTADSLTDTVRLWFDVGYSGARFTLAGRRGADTLRGRVENLWDYDAPPAGDRPERALAVRVPCR